MIKDAKSMIVDKDTWERLREAAKRNDMPLARYLRGLSKKVEGQNSFRTQENIWIIECIITGVNELIQRRLERFAEGFDKYKALLKEENKE